MEWFAETTEALYGQNDFYPYTRSELQKVDPVGAALVQQFWEKPPLPNLQHSATRGTDQK